MTRYFIGAGSNLGDRVATLRGAAVALGRHQACHELVCAGAYETRPLGPGSANFLNSAFSLHSDWGPRALLELLLEIEAQHGRVRRTRWGDRTLDLDLLCAFEAGVELTWCEPGLRLPHPGLVHRDFVLTPLLELEPALSVGGQRCALLLDGLPDHERTLLRRVEQELAPS